MRGDSETWQASAKQCTTGMLTTHTFQIPGKPPAAYKTTEELPAALSMGLQHLQVRMELHRVCKDRLPTNATLLLWQPSMRLLVR